MLGPRTRSGDATLLLSLVTAVGDKSRGGTVREALEYYGQSQ